MKTVPVTILKARLSEFLEKVKAGFELVVTDHGKPVAKFVPFKEEHALPGLSAGLIRPPEKKLSQAFFKRVFVKDKQSSLVSALIREREES